MVSSCPTNMQRILDEEMDGEAVFDAFGCEVGPDCFKDVLPKYGQRIKVYRAIKSAMGTTILQEVREMKKAPYVLVLQSYW